MVVTGICAKFYITPKVSYLLPFRHSFSDAAFVEHVGIQPLDVTDIILSH